MHIYIYIYRQSRCVIILQKIIIIIEENLLKIAINMETVLLQKQIIE